MTFADAELPIILIPDVGGSRIFCGAEELWPGGSEGPQLARMQLDGPRRCAGAGPRAGELTSAYAGTQSFLRGLAGDRFYAYAWDWRKSPEEALGGLDAVIENARTAADADRVALVGHGAGGLVARWYVDDPARAAKVARVLTLGTPFWGTPSAWMTLVHGLNTTNFLGWNIFLPGEALTDFAASATGLYYLFPSRAYVEYPALGPWLMRGAHRLGVEATVGEIGVPERRGKAELAVRALADHDAHLDDNPPANVAFQSIVGTGLATIKRVRTGARVPDNEGFQYGNGDGVVPLASAAQGRRAASLGVHYVCDVPHSELASNPGVLARVRDFVAAGAPIPDDASAPSGCQARGEEVSLNAGRAPGVTAESRTISRRPVSAAAAAGIVQLLELGARTTIVTNVRQDVTLTVSGKGIVARITDLEADERLSPNEIARPKPLPSVSGVKFNDANGNSAHDPGEPGLPGWVVYVDYDGDGTRDAGEPSATSGGDGGFVIADVNEGTYDVREVAQPESGWSCTAPQPTCAHRFTFVRGQNRTGVAFGNRSAPSQAASVSGIKFHDVNGNGALDATEQGLGNWVIYADLNNGGTLDPGEPNARTAPNGSYTITNLPDGTYPIREVTEEGWECTSPNPCRYGLIITPGATYPGVNFGNRQQTFGVFGTKFRDTNGNGARDSEEGGLSGWTIYVDYDGSNTWEPSSEPAATTGSDGGYTITGVTAGTYGVREVPRPFGWDCTFPPSGCEHTVPFGPPGIRVGRDFGNRPQLGFGLGVAAPFARAGAAADRGLAARPAVAAASRYFGINGTAEITAGQVRRQSGRVQTRRGENIDPVTKAVVRIRRTHAVLQLRAKDRPRPPGGGVRQTRYQVFPELNLLRWRGPPKRFPRKARATTVSYYSVDISGNQEALKRTRIPPRRR